MAIAGMFPPDPETMRYGAQTLPTRRMSPGAVGGLATADNAGPEQAGALSLVFGSFADRESAQRGYRAFTDAQRSVLDAPGFLRWHSFADGPHGYGLGWWHSAEEATAWARGAHHRAVVREQRTSPFELSQFASIWIPATRTRRTFSCPSCHATIDAAHPTCTCGEQLDDGFAPTPQA
ncbi:MAG: antibiotic biosynthesis monooxygenase [Jatrophihabitantaceae bacterium]